jgi:universal stress protein E
MEKLTSILVVIAPGDDTRHVLEKAMMLARLHQASVELFLSDSEQAQSLRHSYDQTGVAEARDACVARGQAHLDAIASALPPGVAVSTHVACESPLCAAVVDRALESGADLVMKSPAGQHPLKRLTLDANDWQLARSCPVPLMLTRCRSWRAHARFAAAIDVSTPIGSGLARAVVHTADYLARGCGAQLDVVFSDSTADNPVAQAERGHYLKRLVDEYRIGDEHLRVLHGEPETTLPVFAAQLDCDVLILGALTGRSNIAAVIGTLTSKLVDALDCDFVLVKSECKPWSVAESARSLSTAREGARLR